MRKTPPLAVAALVGALVGFAAVAGPLGGAVASSQQPSTAATGFVPPPPAVVVSASPGAKAAGYHATVEHFVVHTGPGRATACTVVGELFVPSTASAARPVPAILTTNGFGGSYRDQVSLAEFGAEHGFVVLTYSGLGFGGSGCNIELDSPVWDGEAASQLISYLGSLPTVTKDGRDDPRVGMIGGSYGGEVQLATASIDPRLDTIVPVITWNDLSYSLAPNNDAASFRWSASPPGVLKWEWSSLFFGDGLSQPFQNPTSTPFPPSSCPGFDPAVCTSYLESVSSGYPTPDVVSMLRSDSAASYYRSIHVPVMLMQGEADSLFDVAEAVANFQELRSVGDPVKLVLQSWGHSNSTPAPGELSYTSTAHGYETLLILDWFDRYLKRENVSTGPAVEYFRPWVRYATSGSAASAYGTAGSWPVGGVLDLYLSGDGALVRDSLDVVPGAERFAAPAGGEPASYSETSGVQDMSPFSGVPPSDPPGTTATFESPPLPASLDSVGIPVLHVDISGALGAAGAANPGLEATVFTKIYDVAPDGSVTLVERLVAPARIASLGEVALTLPGVVHRYQRGDRIELVVAATDQAYIGSRAPDVLTVTVGSPGAGVLQLPAVSPADEQAGGSRATGS